MDVEKMQEIRSFSDFNLVGSLVVSKKVPKDPRRMGFYGGVKGQPVES